MKNIKWTMGATRDLYRLKPYTKVKVFSPYIRTQNICKEYF